jgi:hypothetical protein
MPNNAQFVIRLGVNSSGVTAGINAAVGQIQRLTGGISTLVQGFLGLAIVRWGTSFARDAIATGSAIEDTRKKVSLGAKAFQVYEHATKKSGGTTEGMVTAMKNLAKAQIEALKGSTDLRQRFERYGITLADLRKMNPEELFRAIARAIGEAPDSATTLDDTLKLLGKAGDDVLPAFRNGFADAADEAERLGLVIASDITAELDRAGDEIDILIRKWKVFSATVTGNLIKNIRGNLQEIFNFMAAGRLGGMIAKVTGSKVIGEMVAQAVMAIEQEKDAEANTPKPDKPPEAPGDVRKVGDKTGAENFTVESDALARIGGSRGGNAGELIRVQFQQLEVNRRMERHLAVIAQRATETPPSEQVNRTISGLQDLVHALAPLTRWE